MFSMDLHFRNLYIQNDHKSVNRELELIYIRVYADVSSQSVTMYVCSCPLADYAAMQLACAILLMQTKNVLICVQMGAHC